MYKRNQIKKFTIDKIINLAEKEQNGQTLNLFNEVLNDRNKAILQKRDDLLMEIEQMRQAGKRIVFDMNVNIELDRKALKTAWG